VLDLVAQGVLEARDGGLYLHVRPAIVSILAVTDDRGSAYRYSAAHGCSEAQ
jgi:hypothetical protein